MTNAHEEPEPGKRPQHLLRSLRPRPLTGAAGAPLPGGWRASGQHSRVQTPGTPQGLSQGQFLPEAHFPRLLKAEAIFIPAAGNRLAPGTGSARVRASRACGV